MTDASTVAEQYYDSPDADAFYHQVWGGDDIHIGVYDDDHATVRAASAQTVATMAALVDRPADTTVVDLGAGYGGSARFLAREKGWSVLCLNISEVQNERNRRTTRAEGLDDRVEVRHGSFDAVPLPDDSADVVWSQDAILHADDRSAVLDEISRIARSGADVVFTDPMQSDDCPDGVLDPVLARINLPSLASPAFYRHEMAARGFTLEGYTDLGQHLRTHYATIRDDLTDRDDLPASDDYVESMTDGLGHWIDGADRGHLTWGIFHFRKLV